MFALRKSKCSHKSLKHNTVDQYYVIIFYEQRTIDSLKGKAERAVELETEKDELNQQLQQLRKSLEGQKTHKLKQEQMEFELIDMGNEKQVILWHYEFKT